MPHPFRFGVSANAPRSKSEWMAFAQRIEGMGYDTLVMADHFGPRFALGPALVLAAAAAPRLRVGSLVYDNDFRHPGLLAQEIATIDLLTDGRFDFGIGAGWLKREYEAAGIAFDSGGVRVDRLGEALVLIKRLLSGEPVTIAGSHYRISELSGERPMQQPRPPLLIGGGGPRLLALAAEQADIISVMPRSRADGSGLEDSDATEASFKQKVDWIRERAGGRFGQIVLNTLVQAVTVTDRLEEEMQRLSREWDMAPAALRTSPLLLVGSLESMADTLLQRRARLGISYITIFEKDVEPMARVIEQLRTRAGAGV